MNQLGAPLLSAGCCHCRKVLSESNKRWYQADMNRWKWRCLLRWSVGGWSCDGLFPFFFSWPSCCSATSLPLFVRLSVCFPATGVCEPASPPRGEGIRRPADEEQLLLQEPETREGGRKDPQGVGQTEGSVCGDGNKNSLTSPDNKNNSRFVWLVVKYRGKKWFISQYVSTSLDAENHRSAAESNQVH